RRDVALGDARDGEHSLRRLGGRDAREVALIDLENRGSGSSEGSTQRLAARGGGQQGADDGSPNGEAGAKQLLDASHALDHEELPARARAPALEVAGEGK